MTELAQNRPIPFPQKSSDRWGEFIEPDVSLHVADDLVKALELKIYSGHQAIHSFSQYRGFKPEFDRIVERLKTFQVPYEDQCSAKYYYDVFQVLEALRGQFTRVAEVGVFMGGASVVLAGAGEVFDFDLDLIDVNPKFLRFSYERIRRTHPGFEGRVRLFYGGLAEYTARALVDATDKVVVHHDGAHDFPQVVRDLSSLYFARQAVHAVICQDTHLRGRGNNMNFVDMALYAVFGTQLDCTSIGTVYGEDEVHMTSPNQYQGNYFLAGEPEGKAFLLEENTFLYPHASMQLEEFLSPVRD